MVHINLEMKYLQVLENASGKHFEVTFTTRRGTEYPKVKSSCTCWIRARSVLYSIIRETVGYQEPSDAYGRINLAMFQARTLSAIDMDAHHVAGGGPAERLPAAQVVPRRRQTMMLAHTTPARACFRRSSDAGPIIMRHCACTVQPAIDLLNL